MRREDGEFSELLFTLKPPDFMAIYCELSDESCGLDSYGIGYSQESIALIFRIDIYRKIGL